MPLLHPLESSVLSGMPDRVSQEDAYRDIRSRVLKLDYLPYWEAEDLASDVWAEYRDRSMATVAAPDGRPVPMLLPDDDAIREAVTARRKAISGRRESSSEDVRLDDDSVTTYLDESAADGLVDPVEAYTAALQLRETLRLPDLASVVAALTMGLTHATEAETAAALKVKPAAWHKRVGEGRQHILSRIPDPARLLSLLDSDRESVLRTARPVAADKGQPLYRVGLSQSRTARATVLLATPQRPGLRTGSKLAPGHQERAKHARIQWSPVREIDGLHAVETALLGGRTEGYGPAHRPTSVATWERPNVSSEPATGTPADVLRWIEANLEANPHRTDETYLPDSPAGTRGTAAEVLRWIADLEAITSERPEEPATWWPNGITAGQAHYCWPHPAIRRRLELSRIGHPETDESGD